MSNTDQNLNEGSIENASLVQDKRSASKSPIRNIWRPIARESEEQNCRSYNDTMNDTPMDLTSGKRSPSNESFNNVSQESNSSQYLTYDPGTPHGSSSTLVSEHLQQETETMPGNVKPGVVLNTPHQVMKEVPTYNFGGHFSSLYNMNNCFVHPFMNMFLEYSSKLNNMQNFDYNSCDIIPR